MSAAGSAAKPRDRGAQPGVVEAAARHAEPVAVLVVSLFQPTRTQDEPAARR